MRLKSSKIFNIFLAVSLILFPFARTEGMQSSNYIIEKDSINFSGTDESESANYKLSDTMGEISTGESQAKCSSLSFDGDGDYVEVTNNGNSLNTTGAITVSTWVYSDNYATSYQMMAVRGEDDTGSWQLRMDSTSRHPQFCINDGLQCAGSVDPLTDGNWYHIVGTYDKTLGSNNIKIYVNAGTPVGAAYTVDMNNNGNVHLGRRGDGRYLGGSLEDTRIYNRALSSTEISDLYNGKQIDNTGLKGQWGFNEGSGTSTADLSGNGNDGTIYNATFSTDTPSVTCNILNAGYRQDDSLVSTISISVLGDVILDPPIGGVAGGIADGNTAWTVITNNPAGYQMSIKAGSAPALQSGSYSFADYMPGSSNPDYDWSVAASASEFGYSVEGAHTVSKFLDNGAGVCSSGGGNVPDRCWLGFSMSDESIATSSLPNNPSGTATTVKFRAQSGNQRMQQEGNYTADIVVTAVAL